MFYLVYGGSGSGKSEYAEGILMSLPVEKKFYIATMKVYGEEGLQRVERHRKLRLGKGFVTVERALDVGQIDFDCELGKKTGEEGVVALRGTESQAQGAKGVLLECLSNLVANEMFVTGEDGVTVQLQENQVCAKVVADLNELSKKVAHIVIVSNNVFDDGIEYDESSKRYLRALAAVNASVGQIADKVIEVVAGIPVEIK